MSRRPRVDLFKPVEECTLEELEARRHSAMRQIINAYRVSPMTLDSVNDGIRASGYFRQVSLVISKRLPPPPLPPPPLTPGKLKLVR